MEKLEYIAAFYYIINLAYIFNIPAGIIVHAINFKVAMLRMKKNIIVIFVDFEMIITQKKLINV